MGHGIERDTTDTGSGDRAPSRVPTIGGDIMTNSNNYPFLTKAQIVAKLECDLDFVHQACLIMTARQTEDEIQTRDTKYKNRRGWMSSHAVFGTKMAEKIAAGEELTDEENGRLVGMVVRYRKQLAAHFREQAKAENPELAESGSVFGV
jgi:hypothetical protein